MDFDALGLFSPSKGLKLFKDLSIICFLVLNIDLYDISGPSLTEQDTDFSLDMLFDNEYCLEALSDSSLDFLT